MDSLHEFALDDEVFPLEAFCVGDILKRPLDPALYIIGIGSYLCLESCVFIDGGRSRSVFANGS